MAKWMPSPSRLGIGRSRGVVAPVASRTASLSATNLSMPMPLSLAPPISAPVTNSMPSSRRMFTRRSTMSFSSFILGMPYMSRPPMRLSRSYTVTLWPDLFSCAAAARPAGPEPTTATVLPLRDSGGCGLTQPFSKPLSMMAFSMFLMVTGGSVEPSTQDPSQGAGQTRPVNSGKLFVLCRRSSASSQRPL